MRESVPADFWQNVKVGIVSKKMKSIFFILNNLWLIFRNLTSLVLNRK